jgi:hypothetical protein
MSNVSRRLWRLTIVGAVAAAMLVPAPAAFAGRTMDGSANCQCLSPGPDTVIFQIGTFDPVDESTPGGPRAWDGALEYPANDNFYAGGKTLAVTDTLNPNPDFPGYLATMSMSDILAAHPKVPQDRPLTDAAPSVTLQWTQCKWAHVTMTYARYGSESDDVTLDGVSVGTPISQEDILITELYDFGNVAPGKHEITISYVGDGRNDGHYIDAIRLEGTKASKT